MGVKLAAFDVAIIRLSWWVACCIDWITSSSAQNKWCTTVLRFRSLATTLDIRLNALVQFLLLLLLLFWLLLLFTMSRSQWKMHCSLAFSFKHHGKLQLLVGGYSFDCMAVYATFCVSVVIATLFEVIQIPPNVMSTTQSLWKLHWSLI